LPELFLDEDVPPDLGDILEREGLAVHTVSGLRVFGAIDAAHLKRCVDNKWVLVTQNRRDFRRLHWLWTTFVAWGILPTHHSGILTVREQVPLRVEQWALAITELMRESQGLDGAMYMWRPSTSQWERQEPSFI